MGLVNPSLDRFSSRIELPFEPTLELSESEIDDVHGFIDDKANEEGELPTVDYIMSVYCFHPDLEDEVADILESHSMSDYETNKNLEGFTNGKG